MEPPQPLLELDLGSLVGKPVAEAKQAVEAAGGSLRTVAPGQAVTLDYRSNRVTVLVEDDRVVETRGLG